MSTQVYPFVKDDKGIFRPWVPIKIISPTDAKKFIINHALLDTGADECVFPKFAADQTGIADLKASGTPKKEMQGINKEKIEVWFHSFKIQLLTPDLKKVFWASKEMIVGCVDHDNILPILGFGNLMCHFKITFNYTTRKLIIDERTTV
jgi:hypothetical protein